MYEFYLKDYKEELESEVNKQSSKLSEQEKQEKIKQRKKTIKSIGIVGTILPLIVSINFLILLITIGAEDTVAIYAFTSVIMFVVALCFLAYTIINLKKTDTQHLRDKIVSEVCVDVRKRIMNKVDKLNSDNPDIENFEITKSIKFKTLTNRNERIFIDNENKKFVFKFENGFTKHYSFKDLISYEINENKNSVVKGTAGKAFVGGLFFGLEGMIIGGNMSRKVDEICDNLQLVIRLNDIEAPQVVINYIENHKVNKVDETYRTMKTNLQEICSNLEFIMNNKSLEQSISNTKQEETKSKKEQLEELKSMLDEGLITQEDYDKKKNQILGIN